MTYEALSAVLRANANAWFPQPNLAPQSYEALKRSLGVVSSFAFQEHSCKCGKTLFDKCEDKSQWMNHREDICAHCGGLRFSSTMNSRGETVLVPNNFFYYFGLEKAVIK